MEFGIFTQGFLPGAAAHDPVAEHRMLFDGIEYVKCVDATHWKYVWISEHHALTEYSHISASDVVARYLAAVTERIHIASGIFSLSPRVGRHVIPEFDRDPVHRTDRMRAVAQPDFGPFEHEPAVVETVMTTTTTG